jgi:simple sugar transport system permease protein
MKERLGTLLEQVGRPAVALLIALLLGGVLIAVVQRSLNAPFAAYSALFAGAFGDTTAWANTLRQTTPLLLTGLSVAVALAAGLFNIGAEGQMAVGALASALTASLLPAGFSSPVAIVLSLLVGAIAGGVWGFLPAFLKVKRGAHEVITAILLNYIAQNGTRYLASSPLKDPLGESPVTREVSHVLPRLLPTQDVHFGLFVALAITVFMGFALRYSVWGYRTRMTGSGTKAAEAAGIPTAQMQVLAFVLAGAFAGIAGAVTVLGESPFRRFPADFYGIGYGFDGLAVALLAAGSSGLASVWGVFPSALLFGALGAGAEAMDFTANVPKQIVQVVQAILIALIAARFTLRYRRRT